MAKRKINIRGEMIPNDYKWYYDYIKVDSTCPNDVAKILNQTEQGEEIEVYINSPGGIIDVGSEIYTMLRTAAEKNDVKIYIVGQACSAASVAACAAHSAMSPTALMMVHCVSSGISGNHADMEHMAEVLRTADKAMCTAYVAKSGMSEAEALEMMEKETWLTAQQAKERGLVDEVMFEPEEEESVQMVAGAFFRLPAKDRLEQVRKMIESENRIQTGKESDKAAAAAKCRLNALKLMERKNVF